jgi:hypothetical protein
MKWQSLQRSLSPLFYGGLALLFGIWGASVSERLKSRLVMQSPPKAVLGEGQKELLLSRGTVLSIESMEPVTLFLSLAAIVGTGALTKVGENIADAATKPTQRFLDFLKRKAPESSTVQLLEAGESIDYGKAYLELEPISQEPEAIALLEAVKIQVEANPELAAQVEAELNGNPAQISTVIENWKGINIKGGTNVIKDNTFNF